MAKHNVWMFVSDLMTGLMIIFLFIAVSYISKNQEKEEVLREYIDAKMKLHDKLEQELSYQIKQKKIIELNPDLSMRFTKAETCFDGARYEIKPEFSEALDTIMPLYFNLLLRDTLRSNIKEIRIEGHTDGGPNYNKAHPCYDPDTYIYNVNLSQKRALEILMYLKRNIVSQFEEEDRKTLEFWLTASGMAASRALDKNSEYIHESGFPVDRNKSRRVEIRLITRGDEILENFVKGTEANKH